MKKRIISLILASTMLLSITSCKEKAKIAYYEGISLKEYVEQVEMPENLTISIDPEAVEERETVKVYDNVEFMDFDEETMKELFLQNPVTEEEIYADGSEYVAIADNEEHLTVYDGGEAFYEGDSEEYCLNGGFTYFVDPFAAKPSDATRLAVYPQVYSNNTEAIVFAFCGVNENIDRDLDFATRDEIAEQASSFLQKTGLAEFDIHEILAYDMEAIDLAVKYGPVGFEKEPKIQKSDEHYSLLCRQLVNGIPINGYDYKTWDYSDWIAPVFALKYTEDGLLNAFAQLLVQQPSETEGIETEILSAVEALECLKEYYNQGILTKPYTVEEMELVYIEYFSNDLKTASLKPYWLFKTSYQQDYSSSLYTDYYGNPFEGEIKAYDFTYFDAVTGEYFKGSTSGKPV